ncbi:MAG: hypothetical protein IKK21_10900 [Clostridia bacterium]|nr:hypothetical protein [Clostridia bacterium]
MLTALRRAVNARFAALPLRRRPALRRSDNDEYLLATDLPLTCDEETTARFICMMEADGWRVTRVRDWLWLDHPVPPPQVDPAAAVGELGCLIALLERHPAGAADPAEIRALVKAQEAGTLERLCAALHRDWAVRLRCGEPLPGALLPWLYACAHQQKSEV